MNTSAQGYIISFSPSFAILTEYSFFGRCVFPPSNLITHDAAVGNTEEKIKEKQAKEKR